MKARLALCFVLFLAGVKAQVSCEGLKATGGTYSLVACKNGKAKLYNTDTAITNRFVYKSFNLKLVSECNEAEKTELKKMKVQFKQNDTIMFYDWDIMQSAKLGYFGPAVGRVHFNCKDSAFVIYKYFINATTKDYIPTHFKLLRMGQDNFIFYDSDHPYLNINYYFKKKVVFSSDK
jgi:hypothetical protein